MTLLEEGTDFLDFNDKRVAVEVIRGFIMDFDYLIECLNVNERLISDRLRTDEWRLLLECVGDIKIELNL
jgi:hypothetical protein